MTRPYATRHLGRQDGLLARRFRSGRRVHPLLSGVPRWWTTQGRDLPWRIGRHLSASGLRLQSARMDRLWAAATGGPLPPMRPTRPWTVPPSWRADR